MPTQCPVCSKINPPEAYYCYYDGRPLSAERGQGPLHVGNLPFPTPFCFSDGQACANFNQLALACDNRWEEARTLLGEGVWRTFFVGIGRLDLAAAAKQAATDPDPDRGLSQLLERLPADPDCLRPPKLALESREENLGQLTPGVDRRFELVIINQGMLLLRGAVASQCEWLVFGDRSGPRERVFQTRNFFTVPVCVVGSHLRAGLMPLLGEIVIDTNGGAMTVPVHADVPIRPFPMGLSGKDVLAGARSPREVAVKAREHPAEAASVFEQGAVKAWYASNGWAYPVEGTQSSGKAAVQQFFEALGLTKPPRLEINVTSLTLKGRSGEHLRKSLTIRTEEAKPVYAQASSNENWLQFGPSKYQGNKVSIPVEMVVPSRPGETLVATVTILGNGKQQFVVPVRVTVERGPVVAARPVTSSSAADQGGSATWWLKGVAWFVFGFIVASLLLAIASFFVVIAIQLLQR